MNEHEAKGWFRERLASLTTLIPTKAVREESMMRQSDFVKVLPPMKPRKKVKEHEIKMHEANKNPPKLDYEHSIDKSIQENKKVRK